MGIPSSRQNWMTTLVSIPRSFDSSSGVKWFAIISPFSGAKPLGQEKEEPGAKVRPGSLSCSTGLGDNALFGPGTLVVDTGYHALILPLAGAHDNGSRLPHLFAQQQEVDLVASLETARLRRHEDESVGFDHRAQDARTLGPGGAGVPPAILAPCTYPHHVLPVVRIGYILLEYGPITRPHDPAVPHESEQCRADEDLEGHHGRHRVAGHPEHEAIATHAECQRLSWFHGHLPQPALNP